MPILESSRSIQLSLRFTHFGLYPLGTVAILSWSVYEVVKDGEESAKGVRAEFAIMFLWGVLKFTSLWAFNEWLIILHLSLEGDCKKDQR